MDISPELAIVLGAIFSGSGLLTIALKRTWSGFGLC